MPSLCAFMQCRLHRGPLVQPAVGGAYGSPSPPPRGGGPRFVGDVSSLGRLLAFIAHMSNCCLLPLTTQPPSKAQGPSAPLSRGLYTSAVEGGRPGQSVHTHRVTHDVVVLMW